jgi:hypothetical protein
MDIQTNEQSLATIARRIDAIIAELQALKQQVQIIQPPPQPPDNLVEEMAGALGDGQWVEHDELLDWERYDR